MGDDVTTWASEGQGCPAPSRDEWAVIRDWLRALGATDQEIAAAGEDPNRLAADLLLRQGECLSAQHIADRQGVDPSRIVSVFHMAGVAVPEIDRVRFTPLDAEFVNVVEEAGMLDAADGRALMRAVATALDRVAEAAVAFYVQGTEARLGREGERAVPWAMETQRMTGLAKKLGDGMGLLFRHHLRQAVERQRVSQHEVTSRDVARMAVGFVDLVGSTALAQTLDVAELRKVVSTFESRAFEVAVEHGGRVVKFIGDEIMVATIDPAAGCRLLLALVEECNVGGMEPRGGLAYGEVLFRGGDYYGPEVNLASRLVDTAVPGEVLVDRSVVDAVRAVDAAAGIPLGCPSELAFEPGGRRILKGFAEPVSVWTLRCDA